jgi:hypothetical protein
MGARNQVGTTGLSFRPTGLCSLATQFQTRFPELIHRPIAGLKFSSQFTGAFIHNGSVLHVYCTEGSFPYSYCGEGRRQECRGAPTVYCKTKIELCLARTRFFYVSPLILYLTIVKLRDLWEQEDTS